MPRSPFVHLHCHSHYSLLDGASRVPELVAHVKELGMNACAITDHGNLFGAVEFYNGAKEIRRLMGYMPDFFGVYDDMKVIEYLEFFAAAYRIKGAERRRQCDQVLEAVYRFPLPGDAAVTGVRVKFGAVEIRAVGINSGVIQEVMREVDRLRAEAGLPSNEEALRQDRQQAHRERPSAGHGEPPA